MKQRLAKFRTNYRMITGYIIAFLLLLTSYLLTLYSNKELLKQTELVSHTHRVIADVENLLSAVKDGETGLRGYLNSKDTIFLTPFYKSISQIDIMFKRVKTETIDNKRQQEKLKSLKELISGKYNNIKLSLDIFQVNNYTIDAVLLANIYSGKTVMDSIRQLVLNMQDYENSLLEIRSKKVQRRYAALNSIVITSLILAFIVAALGLITFVKESKARKEADKKIVSYQQDLKQRITQLDHANKELQEVRREEKFAATGRIARIIAHEVRNPLTNIDLAVSQIKEEVNKDNEDMNFLFDMVTRNSTRINQLITELLNATRVTDLSFKKVSLNQLLEETIDTAKDRIELNKIEVRKNFTKALSDVSVDAEKIKIAFLNIIINAIEAMKDKEGAMLTVSTSCDQYKCTVEISDNGIGMDATSLGKLFDAYYTTKPKGNGLGLTNTQNIILNHQGNIDVESKDGEGTRVIISLKVAG
ncbi:HAMP domain-containing sensor histidine kinase [soil metagenome]